MTDDIDDARDDRTDDRRQPPAVSDATSASSDAAGAHHAVPAGQRSHNPDQFDPADDPRVELVEAEEESATLLEQMGGISGLIYTTIPILVFVPANAIWNLKVAIIAALAAAAVILVIRLVRRDKLQPAVSGFIGVAICAYIAHRTGSAKGYFLFGIWTTLVYAVIFVLSIVVRWPLVGVIWNGINGAGSSWRHRRRTRLAYDIATAVWAALFAIRYLVQSFLYDHNQTGWLAAARIGMGWPLTAVAVLATVLLVRHADRENEREALADESAADESGADGTGPARDTAAERRTAERSTAERRTVERDA